jgi:hypothetical protein
MTADEVEHHIEGPVGVQLLWAVAAAGKGDDRSSLFELKQIFILEAPAELERL